MSDEQQALETHKDVHKSEIQAMIEYVEDGWIRLSFTDPELGLIHDEFPCAPKLQERVREADFLYLRKEESPKGFIAYIIDNECAIGNLEPEPEDDEMSVFLSSAPSFRDVPKWNKFVEDLKENLNGPSLP